MNVGRPFLAVVATLALAGCGGRKPDATALLARQARATQHVAAARVQFAAASVKLRETRASHTRAAASHAETTRWVTLIVPAVEGLLLRAPEDLKPEVEALKLKVEALSAEIGRTTGAMTETAAGLTAATVAQARGTTALDAGSADIAEINTKLGPDYFEKVETLAQHDAAMTARLNKLAGWGGLLLAAFAALGATRFVRLSPATWAIPAGVFAAVYGASFLLARFWL